MSEGELRQEQFRLHKEEGAGEDEHGAYKVVPISMLKGGVAKPTKVYVDPVKHVINSSAPSPRGWYKDKHEPKSRRPRPCYTEAMLTTPYGGYCPVGCRFCYVTHGTRGYRATGIATVNPDYPEKMRRSIAKLNVAGAAYISSFTEPFQHLEGTYEVTRRLANYVNEAGLPIFFLTRLLLPDWAEDALLVNPYSYMQWSINTSNEQHRRLMSPGTAKLDDVFKNIERVRANGIFVSIQVNPILAGVTTLGELMELVELLAGVGANHVIFKFVEQVYSNKTLLLDRLSKARLPNVDKLEALLSQTIGGVYTIEQKVRLEWLDTLLEATRSVGLTMSTCYEYYDNGAAGANYAPYVTTSDQCHGRGVPVHHRPEPGAKFVPLAGCYRKGCLYCEEYGTQACDNDDLLEARALEYKDLRNITIEGVREEDWELEDSCLHPDDVADGEYWNPEWQTDAEMWGWGSLE